MYYIIVIFPAGPEIVDQHYDLAEAIRLRFEYSLAFGLEEGKKVYISKTPMESTLKEWERNYV